MSFVEEVPYRVTGVYAPIDDIQETIDYTRAFADEQMAELSTAIENLENLVGSYTPSFDTVTADIPDLALPSYPTAPALDADLNENWPANTATVPVMQEVSPDYSFIDPIPPDPLNPSFDYTPGVYSSCLWSDFCTTIRNDLLNGGTGLTDNVYGLIVDRDIEARRNLEDQARRRAYDAVGARGFDLPGGMAGAIILELEREILAKDVDATNSTTIKDFEIADANTRFIKDLALQMEQVQRAAYDNDEQRLFEIAKGSQEILIAIYEQNVKIYIAQWEGVKIRLEAIKIEVESIIAQNESEIKIYVGQIEAYKAEVQAIAAENESKTDLAEAEADIYEVQVRAITSQFTAQVEEIKVALEVYRTELSEVLEKEKINLGAYTSANELAARVAESIANIASQSVASALGAINTGMNVGYSGSESLRYSAGITNSLSESHAYKEE